MSTETDPVIVLYKSATCGHCKTLTGIWEQVKNAIKGVYPKMRFFTVTAKDNSGKFDENLAPKDLLRYNKWFPMILLVPGHVWDNAMRNLGPRNNAEIKNGVKIINAEWDNESLKYTQTYDIRRPAEIARWVKDATESKDFIAEQSAKSSIINDVPTIDQTPVRPIQQLHSNLSKPKNTLASFDPTGIIVNTNNNNNGICEMRIIARPH